METQENQLKKGKKKKKSLLKKNKRLGFLLLILLNTNPQNVALCLKSPCKNETNPRLFLHSSHLLRSPSSSVISAARSSAIFAF